MTFFNKSALTISEFHNKRRLFWYLNISGWLILALIYLFLYYRSILSEPDKILAVLITYLIGFFLSLVLRIFYSKIDYKSYTIIKLTFLILISSVISAQFWYWIDFLISLPLVGFENLKSMLTVQYFLSISLSRSFPLIIWSILYFMINLWMDWNTQQGRIEKANALAQSAQLQMLRYQLNPHFLFNALNSIRALIDEDKLNAKTMITELSEFLRYSLISKNYSDVPLRQELEAIRHYLEIEKKRYEEKLDVEFKIDPLAEEFPVLSFLIHPLVENAIKYGMQTSDLPLRIQISAQVKKEVLSIFVLNTGRWLDTHDEDINSTSGTGTGLHNVKQRLENAFPGNHQFELKRNGNMVGVKIEIHKQLKDTNDKKI